MELDRYLETSLESADSDYLEPAVTAVRERDDRWYGRLAVRSYESAADPEERDIGAVLLGATAVELLREYCRLRSELIVQLTDEVAHSLNREPVPTLLSGDYLHTSAHSMCLTVDSRHCSDCFQTLTTVTKGFAEAFSVTRAGPIPSISEYESFIDETAGSLGAAAAGIGATLADVDDSQRKQFESFGRDVGVVRQLRRTLDSKARTVYVAPSLPDEEQLRHLAEQRLEAAKRTLDTRPLSELELLSELIESNRWEIGENPSSKDE